MGCFNVRSLKNKCSEVVSLLSDHEIDLGCISETWLVGADKPVVTEIGELGYVLLHVLRSTRGGGVGIVYKPELRVEVEQCRIKHKSFEIIEAVVYLRPNRKLLIACIYRSGNVQLTKSSVEDFFVEFEKYLVLLSKNDSHLIPIICGDFNFHLENENEINTMRFKHLCMLHGFHQHVGMPTHSAGSTLDAVLSRTSNISLISDVVEETGTTSDHFLTEFKISVTYPAKPCSLKTVSFREYSSFDLDSFVSDIHDSDLGVCQKFVDIDNALSLYENILTSLLDRHAPIRTKMVKEKFEKPKWWNSDCQQARRKKRQAERRYKKTMSSAARLAFRNASKSSTANIVRVRNNYFKTKMEDAGGNVKQVYGLVKYLLGNEVESKYPVVNSDENLAEKFAGFLMIKFIEFMTNFRIIKVLIWLTLLMLVSKL